MSPHHSQQMSERSQVSGITLWRWNEKCHIVSEWQCHLLSCSATFVLATTQQWGVMQVCMDDYKKDYIDTNTAVMWCKQSKTVLGKCRSSCYWRSLQYKVERLAIICSPIRWPPQWQLILGVNKTQLYYPPWPCSLSQWSSPSSNLPASSLSYHPPKSGAAQPSGTPTPVWAEKWADNLSLDGFFARARSFAPMVCQGEDLSGSSLSSFDFLGLS